MVRLGDIHPHGLEAIYSRLQSNGVDITGKDRYDWQRSADTRMTHRLSGDDEDNPLTQYTAIIHTIYMILEDTVSLDILLGEPLIPVAACIITLAILHNRVHSTVLILLGAILFNVNPLYVTMLYIGYVIYRSKSHSPKYSSFNSPVCKDYHSYEPQLYDDSVCQNNYDYILVGGDLSTLYTAALLSRVGMKCCVLQPIGAYPINVSAECRSEVACIHPTILTRPDCYKKYLQLAMPPCTDSNQSYPYSVRLSPVGTAEDGYTHTILNLNLHTTEPIVTVLRAGQGTLAEDISESTSPFDSTRKLLQWLSVMYQGISVFSITKVLSANWSALLTNDSKKWLDLVTSSTCQDVISAINEDVRGSTILGAIAGAYFCSEPSLPLNHLSALCLICGAGAVDGMWGVDGGIQDLTKGLVQSVRFSGGVVVKEAPVSRVKVNGEAGNVRVTGVVLGEDGSEAREVTAKMGVVSGLGAICTYSRLLPCSSLLRLPQKASTEYEQCVQMAAGHLDGLQEERPVVQVVCWLAGTPKELGLSSCQYIEVSLRKDVDNDKITKSVFSSYGFGRVWSPSSTDVRWNDRHPSKQIVVVDLEAGDALVELVAYSSLLEADAPLNRENGVRLYKPTGTRRDVSARNGCLNGTRLRLSLPEQHEAKETALRALRRAYPQIKDMNIEHVEVVDPVVGGGALAHTAEKYSSQITATSPLSGLYLCGRDVATAGLVGDIQGGWAAATAALGYSARDLVNGLNILGDLERSSSFYSRGSTKQSA